MIIKLILKQFPTHVAYTSSKKNPKYVKINYQNIYNGKVSRWGRATMVDNLHEYLKSVWNKGSPLGEDLSESIEIYTVINHDSITRRKNKEGIYEIRWKPPVEGYNPRWDIENLASIWSKVINDTLIELKYLTDDNIKYINSIKYKFIPIDDFTKRKIIVKFYRNDRNKTNN